MELKKLFAKPVDRPIEGVIKADDEASLLNEVEEYVLTNEVERRLDDFLDAYNNYEGANGAWISGFFGSGKSHLLKILALLLENRVVEGTPVLDAFLPKCEDNEILKGNLKKAATVPSKSILFNIDQKADVISKNQVDALIAVFVKVFDEACGYFGKQPYIANFERELDRDGLFDRFKQEFGKESGKEWEWGRNRSTRVSSSIDAAYNTVTGESASGVLDKYRADYRLSIEDFAEQVNAYIDSQEKGFRLNFLVDEVGQYVADNTKLMTNLQTVAESLATKCKGNAWVIVTAQEDMNTVVGEMGKHQSNDFSKIMARFANRMKLTGQDVEEVIRKRLLLKNDEGIDILSKVYHDQQNNFKTLFDLVDGAQTYRNFTDREHFIHSYPFIPYQFPLFQNAIQTLSQHNAFEGKHTSVGERSMLGVFQQVAVAIGDHKVGQLATFDLMFEGLRSALKAESQQSILRAENQLEDQFAIKVLKALFLVKYIKEFRATVRNMCVLMCEDFEQDLPALQKKVETALNMLDQQVYVQQTGGVYEYLTNEEKDVESDIKNTDVDNSAISDALAKIVFDEIIKSNKIRLPETGQDYPYTRKLDDRMHGREHELAINVISPFHELSGDEERLRMQSFGKSELLVVMPPDDRLMSELAMYKKTEKYVSQHMSITQKASVKSILMTKGAHNSERLAEVRLLTRTLLSEASLYASGNTLEVNLEEPTSRIVRGFEKLVDLTYPNLRMLKGIQYKEDQVHAILTDTQGTLTVIENGTLPEPEQEMLSMLQSNKNGGVRTTMKALLEKFSKKPYGWDYAAVLCTVAKLSARAKVEGRLDGNLVENKELANSLCNTSRQANLMLEPQVEFTASQIRNLKSFYADFFDAPAHATEAKALANEFAAALKQKIEQLAPYSNMASDYPFLVSLSPALDELKETASKPYHWHLTELRKQEDRLFELKETVLDPVFTFMNGPQKDVFDDARVFMKENAPNLSALSTETPQSIRCILEDPECLKSGKLKDLKSLTLKLSREVCEVVKRETDAAAQSVVMLEQRLQGMDEYQKLSDEQRSEISRSFSDLRSRIASHSLVAVIHDEIRRFEDSEYQSLLTKMTAWANPKQSGGDGGNNVKESTAEYITARSLKIPFTKAWLADEADIELYLSEIRKVYMAEIEKGKRVQL